MSSDTLGSTFKTELRGYENTATSPISAAASTNSSRTPADPQCQHGLGLEDIPHLLDAAALVY